MRSMRNRQLFRGFSQWDPRRRHRTDAAPALDSWSDPMPDEMDHAERLATALEGGIGVDGQTRALTSVAHELRTALAVDQLGAAGRARLYEQSMRLAERSATGVHVGRPVRLDVQARRALQRVHVGRRGGVVIGGVAAASVAAAIGFAVVHDRRRRGGVLAHAVGLAS